VVTQVRQVAAEGVGLDRIGTGLEVGAVDVGEHVGPGVVEDLVAALEALEVAVDTQVRGLQHGSHGAVADQYSPRHRLKKGRVVAGRVRRSNGHVHQVSSHTG